MFFPELPNLNAQIRCAQNWNTVVQTDLKYPRPSSANHTKLSNTLKQFVDKNQQIVWVCLAILWGWRLKD